MPGARRPLILVCDDQDSVRRSYKVILSKRYDVQFVANGLEALAFLKKVTPDLVFLDLKMPKRHGMDILTDIKRAVPALPVIVVTGYHSAEVAQEAARLGAVDYIAKPFGSADILSAIAKSLPQTNPPRR